MPLTELSLVQPEGLDPRVVDFWLDLDLPGLISSGAKRLGPHETGDWKFCWLLDTPLNDNDFWTAVEADPCSTFDHPGRVPVERRAVPDQNWLVASYRGFPPQTIGRFFVRGTHDAGVPVPEELIAITLDAATAFGSGEHGTTRGCLLALCDLAARDASPTRVLDLGTGSGILAIAAAKLWPTTQVVAIDNDPEAVKVADEYATLNQAIMMKTTLGDAPADGPYDLVIANILAGPLKDLAASIIAACAPGGTIILSGLLDTQQDEVVAAYTRHGATLVKADQIEDWMTLVFRNYSDRK